MKSGSPMAGTPEISLMNFMIGQMARFYNIPWRSSNTLGGAKTFDAQAGYESATTLMAVILSGANYIWHSSEVGMKELHANGKFVVDAEQCEMAYKMAKGVQWDDFDEASASDYRHWAWRAFFEDIPHTLKKFQAGLFYAQTTLTITPSNNGKLKDHMK